MVKAAPNAQPHGGNRTARVAKNTILVGLDVITTTLLGVLITIPVNRIIGPARLGYFSYIQWLAGSSAIIASLGLPNATRKYVAEFMSSGDAALAKAVFTATFRLQAILTLAVVVIGEVLVFTVTDRNYWSSSALLVLCQLPRLLALIPSQANEAVERVRANVSITIMTQLLYGTGVLLSLWMGWDLIGIALSQLLYMSVEFVLKMRAVRGWIGSGPTVRLPKELRKRMISFGGYGVLLSLLNLLIWDRSDIIFLRRLDGNPSHLTFFSVALNLNDRVLSLLRTLTYAAGITVTAEYGRNRNDLSRMTSAAMRYGLLLSAPALAVLAALGGVLVELMYGAAYRPVVAPLLATALLSTFKPLLLPIMALLQAFERQRIIVAWGCLWAAVNISMDLALIPSLGPLGAALANGIAQSGMVLALWWSASMEYRVTVSPGTLARIFTSAAVCGVCAFLPRLLYLPLTIQLATGVVTGLAAFLAAARVLRLAESEDEQRLEHVADRLPAMAVSVLRRTLQWLRAPAV